jgi:hypothetical protein
MRIEYLAAIAIAGFAAGAGFAAYSVRGQADFCPQPSAASVTALFAPCLTKEEPVQMGLLTPDEQAALTPEQQPVWPATLVAARLAESVDPLLHRSGG